MTPGEINKKAIQLRLLTDAKMKHLRDYSKFLDQAFEELQEVAASELDVIYEKIEDLDSRLESRGF